MTEPTSDMPYYRGQCRHKAIGDIDRVLQRAEANLQSTTHVWKTVKAGIATEMSTLIEHKKLLQMSLVRTKLGSPATGVHMMAQAECSQMLEEQIDCVQEVIKHMNIIIGTIGTKATDEVTVPSEKNYNDMQLDEPKKPPWKEDDPSTWVHYGWKNKDRSAWIDYNPPSPNTALEEKIKDLEAKLALATGGSAAPAQGGLEVAFPPKPKK